MSSHEIAVVGESVHRHGEQAVGLQSDSIRRYRNVELRYTQTNKQPYSHLDDRVVKRLTETKYNDEQPLL